jgi:hypothetical protein
MDNFHCYRFRLSYIYLYIFTVTVIVNILKVPSEFAIMLALFVAWIKTYKGEVASNGIMFV